MSLLHETQGPARLRTRRPVGFTLIELLVVVGITATLLAVGASLFRRTSAEAVKTGTEKFAAMVEQARTTAITRRKPVALVLVSPGEAGMGDEVCRLGLFELDDWVSGEPVTGTQIQRWQGLPGGVGFQAGEFDSLENVVDSERTSLTWRNGDLQAELPMVVFSARGGMLSPKGSKPMVVILASGVHQHGEFIHREGRTVIRIGRVVARPWILSQ
ncbi:type II secretory pathway pseudopilin PulG [Haloferula luteola]|uniref:Type II secretion system protein H n=1 Tax=Haloferula luteola TaxID=595692 RepID=A0A840UY58_9BACT|nr:GspH/FimT family pseudopilin [Haloferula luteola]MBB5349903.1 type II secretory pathway pseudopilin PulG [Haloferula luteola]